MATKKKIEIEEIETTEETKKAPAKKTTTRAKKAPAKGRKTRQELKKKVSRDTEVVVMNNTTGILTYTCPKTKAEYEMHSFGDTTFITVDELITMKNKHRSMFQNYWLIPIAVEDDEVTLEEVVAYVGLDKYFKHDVFIDDGELDDFLTNSPADEFAKVVRSFDEKYQAILFDRAIKLFKDGQFSDYNKMNVVKEISKNDSIFEDAQED